MPLNFKRMNLGRSLLKNKYGKATAIVTLPIELQLDPIYDFEVENLNWDSLLDFIVRGNTFSNHYEMDNMQSLGTKVVYNDGRGGWITDANSGLGIIGDNNFLAIFFGCTRSLKLILCGQNDGNLKLFQIK